jgi:Uma2 family endonuclease
VTADLKNLTYVDHLSLPEMKARYSIVDGELVLEAMPTPSHQTLLLELVLKLSPFVCERHLGKVFIEERRTNETYAATTDASGVSFA